MAFIDNEDDPNNPQNGQGQQPGQAPQLGQGSNVVSGASGGGGGGNPSAGVGPGGTGGWTNIQAYLDANKGDTGSSQLLNKAVGDQFNQERQNFTNDSSKYLNDAQSQADQNKITNDQADQYTNQAASMYYGQPGADGSPAPADGSDPQYKAIVDKFNHALNDKYSGPTSYDYGFGDQTQQYGADLKDNPSFDTLMQGLYSKSAGSPMSSGQYDLQKQFDVNNQALVDARNNLSSQYDQLGADRDKAVADTTTGLGNIEQGYRENQNKLHDFLSGKANQTLTNEQQAEADARAAYNQEYGGGSGQSSIGYQDLLAGQNANSLSGAIARTRIGDRIGLGIWSPDMSWKQLQAEQDDRYKGNPALVGPELWYNHDNEWNDRANTLNNWYQGEQQKYQNTGDAEKRTYDTIADFLGLQDPRMAQGFDVGAPVANFRGGIRGGR